MKRSSFALGPWNRFHAPLPRTPRQSQQLLNALTSSFRRELDREHPTTAPSSHEAANDNDAATEKLDRGGNPGSSSHAADKHFGTILDNPLFRLAPGKNSVRSQSMSSDRSARVRKEPMVIFDELVASGAATPGAVTDCLGWQMLIISRYDGERYLKELKSSGVGSRIVSWCFSSDRKTRVLFLSSPRMYVPCKFLVAEGLHDKIFAWLRFLADDHVLQEAGQTSEAGKPHALANLLCSFLKAEIECGGGWESCMRYYLDTCKMFMWTADGEPDWALRHQLLKAGRYLLSMVLQATCENDRIAVSDVLYEEYSARMNTLTRSRMTQTIIPIYHPTHPDARPFVKFLRDSPPQSFENIPKAKRERLLRAGFDSLRVLVDIGKSGISDVSFVARFLQELVGEEYGKDTTATRWFQGSSEQKTLFNHMDMISA